MIQTDLQSSKELSSFSCFVKTSQRLYAHPVARLVLSLESLSCLLNFVKLSAPPRKTKRLLTLVSTKLTQFEETVPVPFLQTLQNNAFLQ